MQFFKSILVPFRLWQLLLFSPFGLKRKIGVFRPTCNVQHSMCAFFAIGVHITVSLLTYIFIDEIVPTDTPPATKALDILIMVLTQLVALVALIESHQKRKKQIEFLQTINSIDFILEYKVGIDPNFQSQRRHNLLRLIAWTTVHITLITGVYVYFCVFFGSFDRWWLLLGISYFLCSIKFHQIVTYVNLIYYRFALINTFIESSCIRKEYYVHSINTDFLKTMKFFKKSLSKGMQTTIHEKLADLRRVSRLLVTANLLINDIFQWSMPINIANDFFQFLYNMFWVFRYFLLGFSIHYWILPLFPVILIVYHMIALTTACDDTAEEVFIAVLALVPCTNIYKINMLSSRANGWQLFYTNWI